MPVLSNDVDRCEVINLALEPEGRGPYLVRQEGYLPGSTDFTPQRFLLQKDGRWLLNLAFIMLPEVEQQAQLFHSLKDVLTLLNELANQPVQAEATLPEGVSSEVILSRFEHCTNRLFVSACRDA
jgi:hypothetical protein